MMAIYVEIIKKMENETEVRYAFKNSKEKGLLSLDKKTGNTSIIIPIKSKGITKSACYATFREFKKLRELPNEEYPEITTWEA